MNRALSVVPVRRQLTNGLSVHIFPESQFHHTFMSCTVPYGSIHDSGLPGRAHFLEHMMFANPDQQPVKPIFHALGASTSALTRYDVTTYQMACTGELEKVSIYLCACWRLRISPQRILKRSVPLLCRNCPCSQISLPGSPCSSLPG